MRDLDLVAAKFLTASLPKSKDYLSKYFKGDIQEKMVVYFLTFPYSGNFKPYHRNLVDHTGIACSSRWVFKLLSKFKSVEAAMEKAEKEKDHETVVLIRMGRLFRKRKPKSLETPSRSSSSRRRN